MTLCIGFGRRDITPRVGVELQGYGAYLNRHSDGVRDRLYARAMACELDGERAVIVSCDLSAIPSATTERIRKLVTQGSGLPPERLLVHATHTHSGPALRAYSGWGACDQPYSEILPGRITQACLGAIADLRPASIKHTAVSCEGMGINREYDSFTAKLEDALREDWRPAKPELTDTTCQVLGIERDGELTGFLSSFGCHPVIGGPGNRKIHGDYPGVATNLIERLHPGTTGLFLLGAQGDINTAATALNEADTMRALDVLSARYARCVLMGLKQAEAIKVDALRVAQHQVRFSRKPTDHATLAALLAQEEMLLHKPDADDADMDVRQATVNAVALRSLIERMDRGDDLAPPLELHGIRLGPIAFMGTPFEVQRGIQQEFLPLALSPVPIVLSQSNGSYGYAVDRTIAGCGGYAADKVPYITGNLPFAAIHDELVAGLVALDRDLTAQQERQV